MRSSTDRTRPSAAPELPRDPEHSPLADDSPPRDWSELGRRVLAEALRRATDELHRRNGWSARPAVPPPPAEEWS